MILNNTKSNVLKILKQNLRNSKIEKLYDFTVEEWKDDNQEIIKKIQKNFKNGKIVIRSSAIGEDSEYSSEAGKYQSRLNIDPKSRNEIINGINDVINSYTKNKNYESKNQVLIQQQSKHVETSGVLFTRLETNGSPYYTINYYDGISTEEVTSGKNTKSIKIFRYIKKNKIPLKWKNLLKSVTEIEKLLNSELLDIEFGITKNNIVIYQVRPITTVRNKNFYNLDMKIKKIINKNKESFQELCHLNSKFGSQIGFSDMSDWNPSEIIGDNPNSLDYSLYQKLIMDDSWSISRKILGYNDLTDFPLMYKFGNKPYVDLRVSFLSLTPKNIPKNIQKKLIKFYFNKLMQKPFLHDKIEFEIVFSCYDLLFDQKINELKNFNLTKKEKTELKTILLSFTKNKISDFPFYANQSKKNILKLSKTKTKMKFTNDELITNNFSIIDKIIENCKNFGTIHFSIMARYAFIANIISQSMVKKNIIKQSQIDCLLDSVTTPLTEYKNDLNRFSKKQINKKQFLKKYGHLRPGTYDITIPRYSSKPELFDNYSTKTKTNILRKSNIKIKEIEELHIDFNDFLQFLKLSIIHREEMKFEFTKLLSDLIENIAILGSKLGFSRNEMSNLTIEQILEAKSIKKMEIKNYWKKCIEIQKKKFMINSFLILPPLIFTKDDFEIIEPYVSKPNFISREKIYGKLINLKTTKELSDIKNKIILIENADPGYDWIFTKNPKALITKYGGVASHMAIRCSEAKLPAAIGCGELLFDKLINSEEILLDCDNKQITIMNTKQHHSEDEAKKVLKLLGYIK